jgi:hypothetical protein
VIDFDHEGLGFCSITGGYVVRDPGLPTLAGRYVYSDFCDGQLRSLVLTDPGTDAALGVPIDSPSSFGEDACGRVHVVSRSGPLYRLQDGAATPCAAAGGAAPGGGAPQAPGAAADTRRPSVRVRVTGRRTLVPRRRLRVAVTPDELASVQIAGRLRGVARFRTARRQVAAGRRSVLTVRISRRTARELRRTLRRKRVIAALTILARDAAGNQRRATRRIVIRRR